MGACGVRENGVAETRIITNMTDNQVVLRNGEW